MKVSMMIGAVFAAILAVGVFAMQSNSLSAEAVEATAQPVVNLESSTLDIAPCAVAVLGPGQKIKLAKGGGDFVDFCTNRMFERAKKIPKEEFIWSVYDMQRTAGHPLTPLADLTRTFNKIDKNKDQRINAKELKGYAGLFQPPTLGVKGCGTCNSRGVGCKAGCHCHKNGSCGKNGDDAGFKLDGKLPGTQLP